MTGTTTATPSADLDGPSDQVCDRSVQVLVADRGNRGVLAAFLDDWATVIDHETVSEADLYVVDRPALARHRDALLARKRDEHPVFCPVVLLGGRDPPPVVDRAVTDPGAGDDPVLVDECVSLPVDKRVFARRLRNLLVRRTQARALREKAERLDRFASKLSHELRNPLNVLDGYLPIARDRQDDAAFDACRTAIDRMDRMITDTLLLARDGERTPDLEPVSLPAVADACWDAVGVPEARLEVTATTGRHIHADEDRLYALLANLFRNAVEHGGRDVTITVGDLDGGDGFFVADDGVGIPADERGVAFEEGYTTGPSGTGYGLSIVAAVADAHGWAVRVTDGRDGGSRFEVTGVDPVA